MDRYKQLVKDLARLSTPTDGVEDAGRVERIMADLDEERLFSDASASYDFIRRARELLESDRSNEAQLWRDARTLERFCSIQEYDSRRAAEEAAVEAGAALARVLTAAGLRSRGAPTR